MKKLYAWDKGLSYERELKRLKKLLKEEKNPKRLAYYSILLIQLCNGARISEAVEGALEWATTGKREVKVRARKRTKEEYSRLIRIPSDLSSKHRIAIAGLKPIGVEKLTDRVKHFCRNQLGYNTHALRYAFITHLTHLGYSPSLIAKITGHKSLDHILSYTEKQLAEEVLRRLIP